MLSPSTTTDTNATSLNSNILSPRCSSPSSLPPPRSRFSLFASARFKMSSDSLPPLPEDRIVLRCGGVGLDFLAAVAAYPNPDDKIRSTSLKVQGGGNALTCAGRLGLNPRIISKIAADPQGKSILEEFEADGVDTSFLVVSKEGNSPFTYVIVDNQIKTCTCIHTPGFPPMIPDDLSQSALSSALDGTRILYLDARLHDTAIIVALEAARRNRPILIDVERQRERLNDFLKLSSYAVCSAKFPQGVHPWPKLACGYIHADLASTCYNLAT